MAPPELRVVGGTGGRVSRASTSDSSTGKGGFVRKTGPDGTVMWVQEPGQIAQEPPGGGGGDMTPFWKTDVVRDVQFAKWGVTALAGLMAAMLWFLLEKVDTRFDRADDKIAEISQDVGDLRVEIADQRGDLRSILEKIDDKPQTGNPAKPD